jgi:hypothetical protein
MKKFLLVLLLGSFNAAAQINPSNITIEDSFGIPIFAPPIPKWLTALPGRMPKMIVKHYNWWC